MNVLPASPGIYEIRCTNGKRYVGSSVQMRSRANKHLSLLRRREHHCAPLQNAWNKYGEAAFTFAVLEVVPRADLLDRERIYLSVGALFNVATEPTAPMDGRCHSQESRVLMSKNRAGKRPSREGVGRMSAARRGLPLSAEHKRRLAEAHQRAYSRQPRPLVVIDPQGIHHACKSGAEAARLIGRSTALIYRALENNRYEIDGYTLVPTVSA